MVDQQIVTCRCCEKVYTARKRNDESLILPATDGGCTCGSDDGGELPEEEVTLD